MRLKNFFEREKSFESVVAFLALYFTLVLNIPVYHKLYDIFVKEPQHSIAFIISIPIFFFFIIYLALHVLAWPKLIKLIFIPLLLISSAMSYASFSYGVIFNEDMLINIFDTNVGEASSYINPISISWVVLLGILPSLILVFVKIKAISFKSLVLKKLKVLILVVVGIFSIAAIFYKDYASFGRSHNHLQDLVIPTEFFYSVTKLVKQKYFSPKLSYKEIGLDAKLDPNAFGGKASKKPNLVIFLLGETARAQNYPFNGYHRNTTPYTQRLNPFVFTEVASCGTATAVSVPCMFSNMNRTEFDVKRADNQDDVLDIMQRAGIDVLWKENDGGDKHVAKNVRQIKLDTSQVNEFCNGSSCQDEALLKGLPSQIKGMKGNKFVVLHLIGSHGPTYFERYPKSLDFYQPSCQRSDIENCTTEQIYNVYDNTLRYTDLVMAKAIDLLKSFESSHNVALMYMSDHGESLGENGIYLHGLPYKFAPIEQKRVPWMFWMSDSFAKIKNIDGECLRKNTHSAYSQDNLFSTLLGLMDVSTSVYDKKMDIFSECRGEKAE
ncbi:phosphoethanolamine--lipid A transferase [Parashewanella curva]|uniref:Phosphoethanolamine--lipid A transferase n=1 Tax=Parashewanella curva TaxID=2338552 RepID=A0A3L8Q0S6_9GAMM|nr:phosphoethanolamine--lipid A transferase [Parashewanella curva]RLV60418.1 phosphoethanolamine--lipid A transferase [Parashewanella curva]